MTRLDPIGVSVIRPGERPSAPGSPLALSAIDGFARAAGPDAEVGGELGFVRVYVIFSFESSTNEVRVRIVDETGHLIRTIPPESVAEMIATMQTYAGR